MNITLKDIEKNTKPLGGRVAYDKNFIFDLLAAYGRSQGNIARLKSGQLNVADDVINEVAQKGIVYFKQTNENLYSVIDDLKSSSTVVRYSTRFVIVTDYQNLLSIDTKTSESLDIKIRDIDKHYAFFLPWAGMEKAQFISENHADVKAAEKMAKLFDSLITHNGYKTASEWHTLNTFFTRLLFCFFAEDVNIFKKNQFTNAIASYTQKDGSDLRMFITELFKSLDDERKENYPSHFSEFPYVNGKLFRESTVIPEFNKESRDLLIESSSKLDWSNINPDIFGSMFQAVVRPSRRTGLGQHYTSVPNIMKTIEPLFLNELRDQFDDAYNHKKKLEQLLRRISKIKVFDPACGSGNFLIIAYKELRRLEHAILERLGDLAGGTQQVLTGSCINIENFYGIEIDDFAHEVAILSLWLAKHQMNIEFTEKFGIDIPLIPLKESGNIVHGNAARTTWKEVCPNNGTEEIYLIGNPPYKGGKSIKEITQKEDVKLAFNGRTYSKNVDYISIWFLKGAEYIAHSNAKLAFVSTNSVCQGEQVEMFWPYVFGQGLEIIFAYTSFKWNNRAKSNAGVICIIVALGRVGIQKKKSVISGDLSVSCNHINAYLVPNGPDLIIGKRNTVISHNLPHMTLGSMPKDGGNLVLTKQQRDSLLGEFPNASKYIKRFMGSADFIRGVDRYCLWITAPQYEQVKAIPFINSRLKKVAQFRATSDAASTRTFSEKPYRFVQIGYKNTNSIIMPRISSERRSYIPIGYLDKNTVISDLGFAIYEAEPWVFGVVTSKMHMVWVRAVAGRLKTDI
jgi:type I restriction-modification system DNA methylase subunit